MKNAYYQTMGKLRCILKHKRKNKNQKKYWQWINRKKLYDIDEYFDERFYSIWVKLINGIDLKQKIVFDYGCNNGVWTKEYLKKKAIVTGVDYIKPSDYFGDKFIQMDIAEFKSKDKAFLIHSARTLMHLEHKKQEKTLIQIKENLQKGGYILIIESRYSTGDQIYGRDWKETLDFFGFKIIKYVSDGFLDGVLARK